jgi:hypothetical protein
MTVNRRHMGVECARVATVNRPRLTPCLLILKGEGKIYLTNVSSENLTYKSALSVQPTKLPIQQLDV